VDLVEVLLASGADVNQGDGRGRTALHHAAEVVASYGDAARYRAAQLSLIALLLKKGAKVNARDASGDPPLCRALSGDPANPRITVVEMLLKAGAQPLLPEDCKRHDGRSWAPDSHIEALIRSYSRKAK
jgi:ankyrin repeat protein